MFNWLRHIRSRKDKEGKPEAQKAGRPEDSTTTPVGTPAPDAESSITDRSKTKSSPARHAEDIWDQAYDSLQESDAKLVKAYKKILSSRASAIDSASETTKPQNTIGRNLGARREQMHKLIQDGLQKTNREAKIIQGIGKAAKFVLSANDIISTAI
jgi:hypothetical protein